MREERLNDSFKVIECIVAETQGLLQDGNNLGLALDDLDQRLKDIKRPQYVISVVGVLKGGKSTLLNALIFNGHVLPCEVVECTAAIATIKSGDGDMAHMIYMSREETQQAIADIRAMLKKGEEQFSFTRKEMEIELGIIEKALRQYDTETARKDFPLTELGQCLAKDATGDGGGPLYRSRLVWEAVIETTNSLVGENIHFVDTPGIHSPVRSRVEITVSKIKGSDCVILLVPPRGIDQATIDFLRGVLPKCPAGKIFALIGKCDFLAADLLDFDPGLLAASIKKQVEDLQKNLSNLLTTAHPDFRAIQVIPVAPKLALDSALLEPGSNLDSLQAHLLAFLESGKGQTELESSCQRLAAVLRDGRSRADGRREGLKREAALLNKTVSEVEEEQKKIKAVAQEIATSGKALQSNYKVMWDKDSFEPILLAVIYDAKGFVGSCFAEARSKIREMGLLNKVWKYNEKAREVIKVLKARIEMEVFWNIQQKLKNSLLDWHHARREEANDIFRQYAEKIQHDYPDILSAIAEVNAGIIDALEDIHLRQLRDLINSYREDGAYITRLFWNIWSPDCEPVLNDHKKEIIKHIEAAVKDHCEKFKRQCQGKFDQQLNEILRQVQGLLDAERKNVEQVLEKLKESKAERDRRLAEISKKTEEIAAFISRLDLQRDRIDRQRESIPCLVSKPYQTLQDDIEKIVEACRRKYETP